MEQESPPVICKTCRAIDSHATEEHNAYERWAEETAAAIDAEEAE